MNLFDAIRRHLAARRREATTQSELAQLSDRSLTDLGLTRADIRHVARAAAREAALDLPLRDGAPAGHDGAMAALVGQGLGLRGG